jgi:hypothetical protein
VNKISISRIVISVASSSILTVAAWALPARAPSAAPNQTGDPSAVQLQSVSGRIASVETNSFTMETNSAFPRGQQFQENAAPTTMTFQIDRNTSVSGKLAIGASADVSYRTENGNNIAVVVSVIP